MEKIVVGRAFCGRRVITVGNDERSFYAREVGTAWAVCDRFGTFAIVHKVREIESVVRKYIKSEGN